jgi:hypothetical protein
MDYSSATSSPVTNDTTIRVIFDGKDMLLMLREHS